MRRYADQQLALMTNQVDVAVMGYVNLGLMEEKGFRDYYAIAGIFTGGQSLALAEDIKAKRWKDLEGRKIGTAPNSYVELLFKARATLGGADMSKIQTAALDAQTRTLMQQELLRVWGAARRTAVFITHNIEEAILLGDRVVVMTVRPGHIKEIVTINLPRPRDVTSREFNSTRRRIGSMLESEVQATFAAMQGSGELRP
jgi:hypothetical protein